MTFPRILPGCRILGTSKLLGHFFVVEIIPNHPAVETPPHLKNRHAPNHGNSRRLTLFYDMFRILSRLYHHCCCFLLFIQSFFHVSLVTLLSLVLHKKNVAGWLVIFSMCNKTLKDQTIHSNVIVIFHVL